MHGLSWMVARLKNDRGRTMAAAQPKHPVNFGGGGLLVIIMQVNGKSLRNSTTRHVHPIANVTFLTRF